ncbi:MAG: AraC family transcriptional regulator [Erysipelotrichaceae bacterium]|nr:AraC family transcriptional regulator [Erysipelotrichaceae bacterium]
MSRKQHILSLDDKKYKFHVARDELFIDLNLYQFGYEKCSPLHSYGPAIRNHFLFHYILKGKGILDTNGNFYQLKAGQGFLLCPGQISSYHADEDDPWVYTWVEFDGLKARECMTLAGLNEYQSVYNPVNPFENSVPDYMLSIVDGADRSLIRLVGLGMLLMDEIVVTSSTRIVQERKKLRDFYMKEALNFIEGNYQRDISIEEIADKSGLNRSYFSRLFKETFGESPQSFLIKYRMNKASEMLKNSRIPIADVGRNVGYENQLHFSRAFRNIFGISPREYRDRNMVHPQQV